MAADARGDGDVARAVNAIAAGEPVADAQWHNGDPTLDQLKVLYEIGRFHREAAANADPSASVGAPPPVSVGPASTRWGHFYLLEPIGQGATGIVYRAWDSRLAREVAVKLIPASRSDAVVTLAEARRLARVRHPHFVGVFGVEQVDGHVGTWMELLRGKTIHDLIAAQGTFNANEAALVGADVCSALAAVHRAGLLHRDVKAHNVVREYGGRIVLMDLGAGREIHETTPELAGTPLYLAPELLAGDPATVASDLYSVGVLLFFMTTGALPVEASSLPDLKRAHRDGTSRALRDLRPDLPRDFVDVVDRALAPQPSRRFTSAGEMERALTGVVSLRAATTGAPPVLRRMLRGRMPTWAAGVLVAGTALVATFIGSRIAREPAAASVATVAPQAPLRAVAPDQLRIARAFEELASSLGSQGEWLRAIEQYREAENIYRLNSHPDAPLVGRARLAVAWAQQRAGDLTQATANYELAIAKLRDFDLQPLISAALTALAGAHQSATRYDAAAQALDGAIEARAITFALSSGADTGLRRIGLTARDLVPLLSSWPIGSDTDRDWLPDVFEAALGLNPGARDSDGDGTPDGHEDQDGDGVSNSLEFGLPLDPTGVVVHYGANDPEWLAFEQPQNRRIIGQPAGTPGARSWGVEGVGLGRYYATLTRAQRVAALERGWRLSTRGTHKEGRAYANLDLGPEGPRFDLDIEFKGDAGLVLQRNTSVVPYAGLIDTVSATRTWPLLEIEFDPASGQGTLFVNGRPHESPPWFGHRQFQEQIGVFFGSFHPASNPQPGRADFQLVMLVIR